MTRYTGPIYKTPRRELPPSVSYSGVQRSLHGSDIEVVVLPQVETLAQPNQKCDTESELNLDFDDDQKDSGLRKQNDAECSRTDEDSALYGMSDLSADRTVVHNRSRAKIINQSQNLIAVHSPLDEEWFKSPLTLHKQKQMNNTVNGKKGSFASDKNTFSRASVQSDEESA